MPGAENINGCIDQVDHRRRSLAEPARNAIVQRAAARKVGQQILHLVGQYAPALQENVLGVSRGERYRDQLHFGLFGRAPGFFVVAATAGRDHVGPRIDPTLAERSNMIT